MDYHFIFEKKSEEKREKGKKKERKKGNNPSSAYVADSFLHNMNSSSTKIKLTRSTHFPRHLLHFPLGGIRIRNSLDIIHGPRHRSFPVLNRM